MDYTRKFGVIYSILADIAHDDEDFDADEVMQLINDYALVKDRIEFIDVGDVMDSDIPEITPTVGHVEGLETGLFYRGRVNTVFGADGNGKTLAMQAIAMQEMLEGRHVIFIDAEESTADSMASRFKAMALESSVVREFFHYAILPKAPSRANRQMFISQARAHECSLVIIDSAGELMALHGQDEMKDADIIRVFKTWYGVPLAETGAAVVILDHISKSSDGKTAKGNGRKRQVLTGAAYHLEVKDERQWSKTKSGEACFVCQKDRHGTYVRGQEVAYMIVSPKTDDQPLTALFMNDSSYVDADGTPRTDEPAQATPFTLPDDIQALVVEIVADAEVRVSKTYIRTELEARGIKTTKIQVQTIVQELGAENVIYYDKMKQSYVMTMSDHE